MADEFVVEGRDVAIRAGFKEWLASDRPLLEFEGDGYDVLIMPGAPDWGGPAGGFTLYWTNQALEEWAEYYNDLGTGLVRFAALVRGIERDQWFADGPIGFTRWSENFFRQTLTGDRMPRGSE